MNLKNKSQIDQVFKSDKNNQYHNTLYQLANIKNTIILFVCPSKILHKHCFYFLLGLIMVPRQTGNNAYAKFWREKQRVLWYFLILANEILLILRLFASFSDVGDAVASWSVYLMCLTPDQVVRVRGPGRVHCVVFLVKTLYSHGASLHPGV